MPRNYTQEEFLQKARNVHGDKYDYSKIEYVNSITKVCIICPEHGEFWQIPSSHLRGIGCPYCGGVARGNTKDFIKKATEKHDGKYDYSKVEYVNAHTKVCIICPEHGEFWQTPTDHLCGKGCILCADVAKKNTNRFIEKSRTIHGDKFDYSKVKYVNAHTKVCIICPEHGEFWQTPDNHYRWGCQKCRMSSLEKECECFLVENNIKFEKQKKFKWLVYKKEMPLDFFLPDYNIAIECQGEQHFIPFRFENGDVEFDVRKDRDLVKNTLCEKHGIKILYYGNRFCNKDFYENCFYTNLNELLSNIKLNNKTHNE